MEEFKDKLNSFAERLKTEKRTSPIQEVRPIETHSMFDRKTKIVRSTVHLTNELHQKVKVHCAKTQISFKDYVTDVIKRDIELKE